MLKKYLNKTMRFIKGNGENTYAIQSVEKNGTVTLLPVVKGSSFGSTWTPIVKVYDQYVAMQMEKPEGLSREQCIEHIYAFKKQVAEEKLQREVSVTYETV